MHVYLMAQFYCSTELKRALDGAHEINGGIKMAEPIETPITEPTEKTFTQSEVDSIVAKRVARAVRGMPSDEELNEYRTWRSSQAAEQERINNIVNERDTAKTQLASIQAELENVKREKYVLSKGLNGDDAEFVMFKASKLVDDNTTFETAVDTVIQGRESRPKFDWSAPVGSGGTGKNNVNDMMNDLIRGAFK